jgi:Tol biopolymer transport system component
VTSWSPDGKKLAGDIIDAQRKTLGIATYSVATRKFKKLTDVGLWACWLSDSRRLLIEDRGRIFLLDTENGKQQEVFNVAPLFVGGMSISADNHSIYLGLMSWEANIWMLSLKN